MNGTEYLISHGSAGAFGRFRSEEPLDCVRGDSVVVRTERGLERGVVLCAATSRHARLLDDAPVGELLRRATPRMSKSPRACANGSRDSSRMRTASPLSWPCRWKSSTSRRRSTAIR